MSRLLLRAAALVFLAGALAGCDIRTIPMRTVHSSSQSIPTEHCVRRVLTRPVGNC